METKFTLTMRCVTMLLLGLITICASPQRLSAQSTCQMACGGTVNASADPTTCLTIVSPSTMMTPTIACPLTGYKVKVEYLNIVLGPQDTIILNSTYVGKKVKVSVIDATGNSCWGYLNIEDKSAPVVTCPTAPINIKCFQSEIINPSTILGFTASDCNGYNIIPSGLPNILPPANVTVNGEPVKALKTAEQNWSIVDAVNGMSTNCKITYNVLPIVKSELRFPMDASVSCSGTYPRDAFNRPRTSVTGSPFIMYNGLPYLISPDSLGLAQSCNIASSYTDTDVLGKKILRRWVVTCWADGRPIDTTYNQVIFITDTNKPKISTSATNRRVSTGGSDCSARVRLSDLYNVTASDSCSAATISATILGTTTTVTPTQFFNAPVGLHTIRIYASDVAGNIDSLDVTLEVRDNTPPLAVCLETTVALTNDGTATLPANHFDNGSKDECGAVTYSVRRMDRRTNCSTTAVSDAFTSSVVFCCADVSSATPILVEMRVTDASGNTNTCMVGVRVQNKIIPQLTCPASLTIGCNEAVSLDSASLASKYGVPSVSSTCGTPSVSHTVTNNRDQCGVGSIIRKWVVISGGVRVDSCTQTITSVIRGGSGFFINRNNPLDTTDHIIWPSAEVTIEGCLNPNSPRLSPDSIGKPIILYNRFGCGVIAMNPKDEIFTFNTPVAGTNNACIKILRTWTVIDWCNANSMSNPWTFSQVIKVINRVPPTVTFVAKDSCVELATCTGNVTTQLTANASDDCSGSMAWTYSIDLFNDGVGPVGGFDRVVNGVGTSINASNDSLPLGTHRILFTFRDLCGNVTTVGRTFTLSNCKAPTPYYFNGLAIGLMRMNGTGMITTWARDFDKGSSHPCNGKLYFAFSRNVLDTAKTYTCNDIGTRNVTVFVGIIAGKDTIWNSATTTVNIQDNNTPKACTTTPPSLVTVRGHLTTEINDNLKGAEVMLEGLDAQKIMTDALGSFTFANTAAGFDYVIKPKKDDDHINGVNTLDLLVIQRHLLGVQRFNSPYKMIAADINNDRKVSVTDLVDLRKVVLGITTSFPNNTSWRFVDKAHRFASVDGALSELYAEQYPINNLQTNMEVDFTSVKIGDVDATALANATSATLASRSNNTLELNYTDRILVAGEIVTVPISLAKAEQLAGLQLGLSVNADKAEIVKAIASIDKASSDMTAIKGNNANVSWINANGSEVTQIVEVTLRAKTATKLSDVLGLNTLKAEAYATDLNTYDLTLRSNKADMSGFELYQNTPNPFASNTTITFTLPKDMKATLSVYDVKGRMVKQYAKSFDKGMNTIIMDRTELASSGFYYYKLEAGNYVSTKKMVIIE